MLLNVVHGNAKSIMTTYYGYQQHAKPGSLSGGSSGLALQTESSSWLCDSMHCAVHLVGGKMSCRDTYPKRVYVPPLSFFLLLFLQI